MVHPEIRRLQVLNDLIAQTLEVIQQRTISPVGGGLSHSPFVNDPSYSQGFGQGYPLYGQGAPVPMQTAGIPGMQTGYGAPVHGLWHSPYNQGQLPLNIQGGFPVMGGNIDPRFVSGGLQHTQYSPWAQRGAEYGGGMPVDPRFTVPFQGAWGGNMGLNHSRFIGTPIGYNLPYFW